MKTSDIIGCTGSVILLLLVSAWLPLIGPFFSLLIPLPFLFYSSKLGLNQGLITGLITLFIVGLIGRLAGYPAHLMLFCLEFAIAGLVISEIFRRELSFGLTVFWGTVLMLFVGAIFLFLIGLSQGKGPVELILGYFKANLERSVGFYEGTGLAPEQVNQLRQFSSMLTGVIAKIFPALLVVGTGFVIWINIVISRPLFRLGKIKYPDLGQTDRWQAPEYMVWGVIAAGFSLFLPAQGVQIAAKNLLIVLSVIYVFHGLSILLFFFNRHRIPAWARFGIYFLIIIQQVFLFILAFAGLFDQWIDFRKIHRKEAK